MKAVVYTREDGKLWVGPHPSAKCLKVGGRGRRRREEGGEDVWQQKKSERRKAATSQRCSASVCLGDRTVAGGGNPARLHAAAHRGFTG